MIDSNLTWNQQVDLILRRLSSSCYTLNCVKYTLPIDVLKLIYFANIQSIMSYGIIFWGASTTASKVFKLQKKVSVRCNQQMHKVFVNTYLFLITFTFGVRAATG